ncbi:hypothetical protein ACFFRR_002578 [Megaselia abdita]
MRSCFIPLCDNVNKAEKKRKFFVASSKRLGRWQEILKKHHTKVFKETDKLCELHFNEEDIDTKFSTVIKGQIVEIDRLRPKLKDNANPCKNLFYEKEDNVLEEKSQETKTPEKPKLKKIKVKKTKKDNSETETASEVADTSKDVSTDFLNLYEEIYEVLLPSTLWAVFRCPNKEFISFAYMNPSDFKVNKQIVLRRTGNYKVTLYEEMVREIQLTSDKITSEFLSKDIEEIDSI